MKDQLCTILRLTIAEQLKSEIVLDDQLTKRGQALPTNAPPVVGATLGGACRIIAAQNSPALFRNERSRGRQQLRVRRTAHELVARGNGTIVGHEQAR